MYQHRIHSKAGKAHASLSLARLVLATYLPSLYLLHKVKVDNFVKYVLDLESESGTRYAVAYVKDARLAVLRTVTGHPLESVGRVALDKGWPVFLESFKGFTSDRDHLRFLLTLLTSLRGIKLAPVLDVSPIVTPSCASISGITELEWNVVCRSIGIRPIDVEWKDLHVSAKKGPMGHATMSSLNEIRGLPIELIDNIKLLGGETLTTFIDELLRARVGPRLLLLDA